MSQDLFKWTTNQIYGKKQVFQNQPVSVKFPCSRCGANRPQTVCLETESVRVLKCPCRLDMNKEE